LNRVAVTASLDIPTPASEAMSTAGMDPEAKQTILPAGAPADFLPLGLKVGWALGSAGTLVVFYTQALLLLYFLTAVVGLQPAVAGTLIFFGKIFDALLAPIVGGLTDRARTRWGRRRPFLFAAAFASAAGLVYTFNPPSESPVVIFVGLAIISVGYSLFNIPYLAMTAEMTDSPHERTSLMSWRIFFVGIGTLVATSLLPLIAKSGGGGRHGYALVGVAAGSIVFATMLLCFVFTRNARATASGGEPYTLATMLRAVGQNKPFAYLLLAKLLQLVGVAATSASMLFFFKDVIGGGESVLALWGGAANIVSMLAMLFWPALGRRYGKLPVYALSCAGYAVVGLSWLLAGPGESLALVMARSVVSGICIGGFLLMGQSLIPDAISDDFVRTGLRREGVFSAAYSVVEKVSSALGAMLVGFVFQAFGYAPDGPGAGINPAAVYFAIGIMTPGAFLLSIVPVLRIRPRLTSPA
jgi:GPH family glycoside/pentoside/hexuronide:cation symporter